MKCPPGCECGKHAPFSSERKAKLSAAAKTRTVPSGLSRRKCGPGCTCKRHSYVWREEWKPASPKCSPGCECLRHTNSGTWAHRSPEERDAIRKARRKQQWARRRFDLIERKFGMASGEIARMFGEQDGQCYACGKPISLTASRGFSVDHDHGCCSGVKACGKCVLGLACPTCNLGFGLFGDDPVLMVQAASRRMERLRRLDSGRW